MKIATNKVSDLLGWLLSDDTGCSSMAICAWMLGKDYSHGFPPSDESDRGRCIRLLELMPEWVERLDEMKEISKNWAEQIDLIKLSLSSHSEEVK